MGTEIHPTAIIHESANISDNVLVGPYAFIGKNVSIGSGSVIHANAHITNNTIMGENNVVHAGAIIGELAQDITINQKKGEDEDTWVKIGNNNVFFAYSLISRGAHGEGITYIGDHCFFLARSHVGHDSKVGSRCILSHNSMVGGHVELGDYVHIGGGTAVHQHCRLGAYSMIGAMSLILKDVFPFFLADGRPSVHYKVNRIGLQRQNFSEERLQNLEKAFRLLRKDIHHSLENLEKNEDILFLQEWINKKSLRGIGSFVKTNIKTKIK